MADRPMLMSGPMVNALRDRHKTQTRRPLKPQPGPGMSAQVPPDPTVWEVRDKFGSFISRERMPYAIGDRVWIRETWAHYQTVNHIVHANGAAYDEVSDGLAGYRADGFDSIEDFRTHVRLTSGRDLVAVEINGDRWRPSIHMPRWASRIWLTITAVRVERVQDISEADALAEGVDYEWHGVPVGQRAAFVELWNSIYGPDAWERNDWVCALTFETHEGNIDG